MSPKRTDIEPGDSDVSLRFDVGRFEEPLAKVIVLLEVALFVAAMFVGFWFLIIVSGSFVGPNGTPVDELGYLAVSLVLFGGAVYLHSLWE